MIEQSLVISDAGIKKEILTVSSLPKHQHTEEVGGRGCSKFNKFYNAIHSHVCPFACLPACWSLCLVYLAMKFNLTIHLYVYSGVFYFNVSVP